MYDLKVFAQMNLDLLFSGFPRIPDAGEEVFANRFQIQLGGGPMVYPIVLAGMGCRTRLGTFMADSMPARICREMMSDMDFDDYEDFEVAVAEPVVVTSVLSEARDRRFVAFNQGVREKLLSAELVYDFLKDARVISAPIGHDEVSRTLHREGTRVVFDVGWSDDLNLRDLAPTLRDVDVFAPNDKEAMKMTGAKTAEDALRVLADHTQNAVVTIGKDGAICYDGHVQHIPALPKVVSLDTTGAGDNFLSGVIYGLIQGYTLRECVVYGNIFSGISVTGLGCFGVPITPALVAEKRALYAECFF